MEHFRVIPRDFFNEAKLLKCLGHFEICIMDHPLPGLEFEVHFEGGPFVVRQNQSDATLYCENYRVFLAGEELKLYTIYNSKDAYPLYGEYKGQHFLIFDERGFFIADLKGGLNGTAK